MEAVTHRTSKKEQQIALRAVAGLSHTAAVISKQKSDTVQIKIHETGDFITIPKKALDLFFSILNNMAEGKSFSIIPSDSEISTQQAADMLNVSRPHIVKLVEEGIIPYKKVGSHRRISIEDLIEYDRKLKEQRDTSLKALAEQAQDLNLGYEPAEMKLIKPILYHSFEQKEQIERELLAKMPAKKRKAVAASLMSIFHTPASEKKRKSTKKSSVRR